MARRAVSGIEAVTPPKKYLADLFRSGSGETQER